MKNIYEMFKKFKEKGVDPFSENFIEDLKNGQILDVVVTEDSISEIVKILNRTKEIFGSIDEFIRKVELMLDPKEYSVEPEKEEAFATTFNNLNIPDDLDLFGVMEFVINSITPENSDIFETLKSDDNILSMIGKKIKEWFTNKNTVEKIDSEDIKCSQCSSDQNLACNNNETNSENPNLIENSNDENTNTIKNAEAEVVKDEPLFNTKGKIKEYKIGGETFIIDEEDRISNKDWGKVDTDEIKKKMVELGLEDGKKTRALAEEIFLYVKCTDSPQCFKFPVAELVKDGNVYKIKYNRKGLATAITYLNYPVVKNKYSKSEISEIKNKAKKLYEEVFGEVPDTLKSSKQISLDWDKILAEVAERDEIIKFSEFELNKYLAFESILNSLLEMKLIDIDGEVFYVNESHLNDISKILLNAIEKIIKIKNGETIIDDKEAEIIELRNIIKSIESEKNSIQEILNSKEKEIKAKTEEIDKMNTILNSYKLLEKKYQILKNELMNSNKKFIVESIDSIENEEEFNMVSKILNKIVTPVEDIKINNSFAVTTVNKTKETNKEDEFIDKIREKALSLIN